MGSRNSGCLLSAHDFRDWATALPGTFHQWANPKGALSCLSVASPALGQSWGWLWPSKGDTDPCTRECLGTDPGAALAPVWWAQLTQTQGKHRTGSHTTHGHLPKCLLLLTEGLLLQICVQNRIGDSILASEMQAQTLREDINLLESCVRTHLWQHVQFSNYLLLTLSLFLGFICALGLQGRTPGVMKASC